MEESTKRKERLQAMRLEASITSTAGPSPPSSSTLTPLSNPLVHPMSPVFNTTSPLQRFDYYTDPMAAYSAEKRKMVGGSGYVHQQPFSSPIRSLSPISYWTPRAVAGPIERRISPANAPPAHQSLSSPNWNSPGPQLARTPSGSWRGPTEHPSSISGNSKTPYTDPGYWNSSGSSDRRGYDHNSSSSRPGISHMSNAYSGRRGSPQSHSGRCRNSQLRGRGRYHKQNFGLGRLEMEHLEIKSMVKDPWRKLKPVVGDILVPLLPEGSWLPKSISTKKAKVVESGTNTKTAQSLAEYLALSFEEAVNDQ
ncbi:hypothetical protein AXF42_Ash021179 [Apostasia shenzhenica]|uniref:Uncharacterized protein n=1 Tax=Apostasia shenzhenica TaxID=1088818 RepID=A0A2I0AA92_9ASPA|nr:hypothetical protein AXF42_Ash021179 [Apostasia shenzhenica]